MSHGILASVSDLSEIRDAACAFIAERDWEKFQDPSPCCSPSSVRLGEVADLLQWLPAESARELILEEPLQAALGKIAASGEKYPVQSHRGVAPTKTDRG